MSSVIKYPLRVHNAASFVDRYGDPAIATNHLFLAVGKNTPWATETAPPVPQDTLTEETSFWNDILAMKQVDKTDVALVVARVNWTSGNTYSVLNPNSSAAYDAGNFYVVSDNNGTAPKRVYTVITAGPGASTVDPALNGTLDTVGATDGYSWQYEYTIDPQDDVDLTHTNWINVNYGSKDNSPSGTNTDPFSKGDAYKRLGARFVMVRSHNTMLSNPDSYRKISLIANPLVGDGTAKAAGVLYDPIPIGVTASDIKYNSGLMLHIEHRTPVYRDATNSEIIKLILEF